MKEMNVKRGTARAVRRADMNAFNATRKGPNGEVLRRANPPTKTQLGLLLRVSNDGHRVFWRGMRWVFAGKKNIKGRTYARQEATE